MGLFGKADDVYRQRLDEEFEERVELAELDARRQVKATVAKQRDELTDLKQIIEHHQKLGYSSRVLEAKSVALDQRDAELDARDELLGLRENHFDNVMDEHKGDMTWHHDAINKLQREAEDRRNSAKNELSDAKSVSRKAGRDEGYAEGYKAGREANDTREKETILNLTELVKLQSLSGAVSPRLVTSTTTEESSAQKSLADAFAKHLTTTIDKAMTPRKDTK